MKIATRVGIALVIVLVVCSAVVATQWRHYAHVAQSLGITAAPSAGEKDYPDVRLPEHEPRPVRVSEWASKVSSQTGIPVRALQAYGKAQKFATQQYPQCGLTWTTLAGIGYVESHHGHYTGGIILPDGTSSKKIRGPVLDGSNNTMQIPDTDNGVLDGNTTYDVAMGPLQFIPQTWRAVGYDGNGDGVASPDNIDDAAFAAVRYLCGEGEDLTTPSAWAAGIKRYNNSSSYVRAVYYTAVCYSKGEAPRDLLVSLL